MGIDLPAPDFSTLSRRRKGLIVEQSRTKSATLGLFGQRDAHVEGITEFGRMGWQEATGYSDRALVEAQIGRWKTVIGDALKSRKIDTQTTEIQIGMKALNRMTTLGRAVFEPA